MRRQHETPDDIVSLPSRGRRTELGASAHVFDRYGRGLSPHSRASSDIETARRTRQSLRPRRNPPLPTRARALAPHVSS